MFDSDLPLSRTATDRAADLRRDPELLNRLVTLPDSRVLLVSSGQVAARTDGHRPALAWFPPDEAALRAPSGPLAERWAFLGYDEATQEAAPAVSGPPAYLAHHVPDPEHAALPAGASWMPLRSIGADLSDRDAGLATAAVALYEWHVRYPRCPRCGAVTYTVQAGWVRRCAADGTEHYPRTDPAVIMAVVDEDDRLLLANSVAWPNRRFSTLAGFIEPGESAEQAVRREVQEESSILVGEVEYRGSQPWPFPASLMLGFRARAMNTEITVDGEELAAARWFTRDELRRLVTAGEVQMPPATSIARALIRDWFGEELPVEPEPEMWRSPSPGPVSGADGTQR